MKNVLKLSLLLSLSCSCMANQDIAISGVKLTNHKEWKNVPFPKQFLNKKNYSDATVTTSTEAYEGSGLYNQTVLPKGKFSYYIENVKNKISSYVVDRWICFDNQFCYRTEDNLKISPSYNADSVSELYTYVDNAHLIHVTPGTHESECMIQISGDAESYYMSTAVITIN